MRKILLRIDRRLVLLGLAGLVVYFFLLPRIHPDGSVSYQLTEEDVLDRAMGFAYNQGYDIQDMRWRVARVRSLRILDSLQTDAAPHTLLEYLQDSTFLGLPAYGWDIQGRRATEDEDEVIEVSLNQQGDVWDFSTRGILSVEPKREALLQAYLRPGGQGAADSIATRDLIGRFWAIATPGRQRPPLPADSVRRNAFIAEDAHAIANFYLERTLLARYDLAIDSVTRAETTDPSKVRVVYSGTEPASDMRVVTKVDISTSGVLHDFSTEFAPQIEEEAETDDIQFSWDADDLSDGLSIIFYLLMASTIFVLFLRRMHARVIDVKSAMQDAIWGGLFTMLLVGNSAGWQAINDASRPILGWLAALGMMAASGFFAAFGTFIITSATDSIGRTVWPKKLETLTLARNARFVNRTIGRTFARGALLGGVFLGVHTLFLYLPGIALEADGIYVTNPNIISSFLGAFSYSGLLVMLTCMMMMLGIGAIIQSKWPNKYLLVAVITVVAAILHLGAQSLQFSLPQWIFSGLIGFVFVWSFLRYDYYTAFIGLLLYYVVWQMSPKWLVGGLDQGLDLWLAMGLIPGAFILGLVGLITNRKADDVSRFVPAYVQEHAQQERLRGELEIARQVQSSLLPRRMPSIQGADIAAMCLPAQEVGGDYFDFIRLDEHRLAVVIGDVSGKGIQAGFFMTLTKGFLHAVCSDHDSPAAVLSRVNALFCKNVPRGTFISLIYGILDIQQQTFTFARAGHDPMLYLEASSDTSSFYQPNGMAIGLTSSHLFNKTIEDEVISLKAGDLLVFYTDGITEAVNPHMEQFGVDRLAQQVTMAGMQKSARQVLQEVSEHVQAFCQTAGRADDMTMVVLRIPAPRDAESTAGKSKQPALAT